MLRFKFNNCFKDPNKFAVRLRLVVSASCDFGSLKDQMICDRLVYEIYPKEAESLDLPKCINIS